MKRLIFTFLMCTTLICLKTYDGGSAAELGLPKGLSALIASAQKLFPQGLTIIVGLGTGGGTDTSARILQPYLRRALGVPVVIQNMPGAGGIVAANYVFTQSSDAPILLMTLLPATTIGQVIGKGAYDLRKLTPIYGIYGNNTITIIARKGSPFKNFASLKSATTPITASIPGVKSSAAWEALAELAEVNGIHMIPVPFKGGAEASDAAIGGSVDLSANSLVPSLQLIKAGKAQAVLEFAQGPLPDLPGVESIAKVGASSEVLDLTLGLTGPPGMSKDKVSVLSAALGELIKDPTFAQKAKNVGLELEGQPPAVWGKTLAQSYEIISREATALEKFTAQ